MAAAEPLDGRHARAGNLRHRHQARIDGHAIDEYRARPALAFAASFFGAGQPALLPQRIEEACHRMGVDPHPFTVQRELHDINLSGVAGI